MQNPIREMISPTLSRKWRIWAGLIAVQMTKNRMGLFSSRRFTPVRPSASVPSHANSVTTPTTRAALISGAPEGIDERQNAGEKHTGRGLAEYQGCHGENDTEQDDAPQLHRLVSCPLHTAASPSRLQPVQQTQVVVPAVNFQTEGVEVVIT